MTGMIRKGRPRKTSSGVTAVTILAPGNGYTGSGTFAVGAGGSGGAGNIVIGVGGSGVAMNTSTVGAQSSTPQQETFKSKLHQYVCEDYQDTKQTFPPGMWFKFYMVFGWTLKRNSICHLLVADLKKHPQFWHIYKEKRDRSSSYRDTVLYNENLDIAVYKDGNIYHEAPYDKIVLTSGEKEMVLTQIFDYMYEYEKGAVKRMVKAKEDEENKRNDAAQHKLRQKLNDIGYL